MKTWREDLEQAIRFTETFRSYEKEHVAIRDAMCLRVQYPYTLEPIQAGDLIAGRYRRPWVRFTPHDCDELAFTFDVKRMKEAFEDPEASEAEKQSIMELIEFWKSENTQTKVLADYPSYMEMPCQVTFGSGNRALCFRCTDLRCDAGFRQTVATWHSRHESVSRKLPAAGIA